MDAAGDLTIEDLKDLDFDELSAQLTELTGGPTDILAALSSGQDLDEYAAILEQQLHDLEQESAKDYVCSSESLGILHKEISESTAILDNMETVLTKFQSDLSGISEEIRHIQADSVSMNIKLKNRKAAQQLLSEYINSVVVSPQLIQAICEDEVDETYIQHLEALDTRLDKVQFSTSTPSSQEVAPELEKLKTRAVARVRDFLYEKIGSLKKPKTNVQILQRNVLLKFKPLYEFLQKHQPQLAADTRTFYIHGLSRVYVGQFKLYVSQLGKLKLENAPTRGDTVVPSTASPSMADAARDFASALGWARPAEAAAGDRGNFFALAGRNTILDQLEKDPVVATSKDRKYYFEALFRSHQKLFVDVAITEYFFIYDFFGMQGVEAMFKEVFQKTVGFFLETVESFLPTCWDAVGILLCSRIVEHHKAQMSTRGVRCLDAYLDQVHLLLRPRLKYVIDQHSQSVRAYLKPRGSGGRPVTAASGGHSAHTHVWTRRYAELCAALHSVRSPSDDTLRASLRQLSSDFDDLLKMMASELETRTDQKVFLVNNYDLILTIFHERDLPVAVTETSETRFREEVSAFVELQITEHFPTLVKFVQQAEAGAPGDFGTAEKIADSFAKEWRKEVEAVRAYVMTAFANFNNGTEVLKQVLTQLLLYYTRFQKQLRASFPDQSAPLETQANAAVKREIMQEIKRFTQTF